jgi:hypothetical protein
MYRKTNSRQAREHLRHALAALEDPVAYCLKDGQGRYAADDSAARAYATGGAKALIAFALRELGEPINPFKATGE